MISLSIFLHVNFAYGRFIDAIILSLLRGFKRFLIYMGWQIREGLENMELSTNTIRYTDPGLNNDPLYLAKLNAANISYLKDQIDKLNGLKTFI